VQEFSFDAADMGAEPESAASAQSSRCLHFHRPQR